MPFCPNLDCPHRKRLGEPAEFLKGVAICSDCDTPLTDTAPVFEPLRQPKTVAGWKCPECGSINREDMALCSCGFDSNRPHVIGDQKTKDAEVNNVSSLLEDPKNRRTRKWLIFFGVIEVLMGAFSALNMLIWLFMLLYLPSGKAETNPMLDKNMMVMFVMVFGAGAIFSTWMGIGSILARRWTRAIMMVVSAYWFVFGFLGSITTIIVTRGTSVAEKNHINSTMLGNLFMFVILVIFPAIFFLFYRSQNVKAICEQRDTVVRWTDKIPLPVLAVLLLLAYTSTAHLLSLFTSKHTLPFLYMIIKGYPAMIVAIVKVGIYAYLTVAIYKMKMSAWIATMIVTVLDFGLQTVSLLWVNESDYLSSMGYSASQIQQMQSLVDLWRNPRMGLLLAASLILWIGYLLYVRKYFKLRIETA